MPTRDNITAAVAYNATQTMRFDPTQQVTITVTGGPLYAQFAIEDPPGFYPGAYDFQTVEQPMPTSAIYVWTPADFQGRRIVGVRFRSKLSTQLAQVTVNA